LVSLAKLSFVKLLEQKKREGSILFEKGTIIVMIDNELIIIFISSFANLRMKCFAIEEQSFNEIKNMAGNIVPAIASTNSIVSGLQVIEMIKYISDETDKLRSSYVQNQSYKVRAIRTELPVPMCTVCSLSAKPVIFSLDMKNSNFQIMVDKLRELL
jgi:ubiquitin-like 1-activating enzyme E1 B